jgi:hypothetical protein
VGRKRIPTSPASPFYGYPAEVIAEWCGVSVGTAEHYKAGRRRPPTPVLRLFRQYRDQKVLGSEWKGYRVIGDKIFGPDGRFVKPSHIELQGLLWQALADASPSKYHELLKKAAIS